MKNITELAVFAVLTIFLSSFQLQNFRSGETVQVNETKFQNFYAAGGTIILNAPIVGDLIVAGGTITVNDTVYHDVLAAGGNLQLNGFIGDDLRVAGGQIQINQDVMGDILVAGGQVTIGKNSTVHGNVVATGGSVRIDGSVIGAVQITAGDFILNGFLNNEFRARCGKIRINGTVKGLSTLVAEDIEIMENADFFGDVRYWREDGELDFGQSLRGTNAFLDENLASVQRGWRFNRVAILLFTIWYLGGVLLMMVILGYLLRNVFKKAAALGLNDLGKTIGFGFFFVFGIPIIALIGFLSLVGMPVGIILIILYIIVMWWATTISSLFIANLIQVQNRHNWPFWQLILIAYGIFIGLKLFSLIPIIGWLGMLIIILLSFGSIIRGFWTEKTTDLSTT